MSGDTAQLYTGPPLIFIGSGCRPAAWRLCPFAPPFAPLPLGPLRLSSIWVGTPVGLFAVPLGSFLLDFAHGARGPWKWRVVRVAAESLLLVPAWFLLWLVVQVFGLGCVGI